MASTAVANPMDVRMKSRRFIPSRFAFSLPHLPIRCSTCCCFLFWGRGRISSFDTTCVGMGESTPFSASRLYLGIHIAVASFDRSPTNFSLSRVSKAARQLINDSVDAKLKFVGHRRRYLLGATLV